MIGRYCNVFHQWD